MKSTPIKLIYHSMHSRPMPGCLPLFFLMAAVVVGAVICLVHVVLPKPPPPPREGHVYLRRDAMTSYHVRQASSLPLRLPAHADPAEAMPRRPEPLPTTRPVQALEAPPVTIPAAVRDMAAAHAEQLTELPPAAEEAAEKGGEP